MMKFKTKRTNITIPTGEELLEDVREELNKQGGIYIWTMTKILIYLLMKDTGKDEY